MLLKSLLSVVAVSLASAQSCTFGAYQCSGQTVQQCSYGAGNVLSWSAVQTCASGTYCTVGSYVGCLTGTAPGATTAATTAAATKTPATTLSKTKATAVPTTAATQTTAVPPPVTTTSAAVTTASTTPATTTAASGNIPAPPLPAIKKVIYIDNTAGALTAANLAVPGYANNDYNIVNIGFWLDQGAWDTAVSWTNLDAATRQSYVNAFHSAGKRVMVSAYGAAEWPTLNGMNPVTRAQNLAAFVKKYQFDGADIDWEDNNSMDAGTGEAWLITFMQTLRPLLPSPQYSISHAPQAPYFTNNTSIYPHGAYLAVDKAVGSMIDWHNIQFYNQGANTAYDTCATLLTKSGGDWPGTSVFEIAAKGIPLNKIVIGKPITPAGASNTGYMAPASLATCIAQAKAQGWDAGVMGWQFTLDTAGSWIAQVGASL
ncbi:hypothetical protein HDU98_009736 [Podochytrium sp. JEL0797]|nr:hypothetical protein HDU98_009736 [Podochytrium sp. JEL0797]